MQKKLALGLLFAAPITLLGATGQIKWTSTEFASTHKVCVSSALKANPKAAPNQANYYCKCTLVKAATKWTYSEFSSNEEKYAKELASEGAIAKCAQEALQLNPIPSELNQNRQIQQVLESGGQDLLNHRK
jgi:hypothetical protein